MKHQKMKMKQKKKKKRTIKRRRKRKRRKSIVELYFTTSTIRAAYIFFLLPNGSVNKSIQTVEISLFQRKLLVLLNLKVIISFYFLYDYICFYY